MKKLTLLSSVLVLFLGNQAAYANENGFPGRSEFPDVPVIEIDDLHKKISDVVIIDTRSSLEFETLRIKNAINIPVASKSFEQQVREIRNKSDKTMVFYCNGRTCYKSYLSVKKASASGINNTIAYDAGMFEWAKAYPDMAELLGKSPVNPADIIPSKNFKQRLLDPSTFSQKTFSLGKDCVVLDVRDKYQRGAAGLFPGKERWASLDEREKLLGYINKAKTENKTLFIYDEVGKQVRWLQYALEDAAIKNYYFMEHGAKAYYANMMKEAGFSTTTLQ